MICSKTKCSSADETRKAIFEAALEEFAQHSVDGARTRNIAKKAKVNHAAINYHFGSKQEVYEQVIKDSIRYFSEAFAPIMAEAEAFLKTDGKNKKKAIEIIKKILMKNHAFFFNQSFSNFWLLVKREEIFPSAAFETVFKENFKPFHLVFAKLVDVAGGFTKNKKENSMIAIALIGLNTSMVSHKVPFLKSNKQNDFTKDDIEVYAKIVSNMVDKILK